MEEYFKKYMEERKKKEEIKQKEDQESYEKDLVAHRDTRLWVEFPLGVARRPYQLGAAWT